MANLLGTDLIFHGSLVALFSGQWQLLYMAFYGAYLVFIGTVIFILNMGQDFIPLIQKKYP